MYHFNYFSISLPERDFPSFFKKYEDKLKRLIKNLDLKLFYEDGKINFYAR